MLQIDRSLSVETNIQISLAFFNAQIAGMVAENMQREHLGESMAYTEAEFTGEVVAFEKIIETIKGKQ